MVKFEIILKDIHPNKTKQNTGKKKLFCNKHYLTNNVFNYFRFV